MKKIIILGGGPAGLTAAYELLKDTENGRRLIHAPRRECMCMELDVIVKLISIVCDVFKAYLAYLNFKNKQK